MMEPIGLDPFLQSELEVVINRVVHIEALIVLVVSSEHKLAIGWLDVVNVFDWLQPGKDLL